MQAAVLRELHATLRVEEVALAPVPPGYVAVAIAASGVCHTDQTIIEGGIPQSLPAVLGHEGAGVVTEVGAGVSGLADGDHVVVTWVAPCRACFFCDAGQPELCEHGIDHAFGVAYGTAGGDDVWCALGTGTFAERTVVPQAAAIKIDPDFPLELAALTGCAVVTGVGAVLNAAQVQPGQSVAVIGCGGVGLAAIQGARVAGASQIIAVDRVASRLEIARANGATDVVDASVDEPIAAVRRLAARRGVDHAIEVVGLSATISQAYAMTRRGGTITIVGAGSFDDTVSFGVMSLMSDAKRIIGCLYGSADTARDIPRMIELAQSGQLDLEALITNRIGIADVNDAFAAMRTGDGARYLIVMDETS